ncbi:MAG: hypothetical protein RMH75_04495 [Archaeoglobaceae archaeon]|nr:hypothetical protein [Archaeoglobaceae archaeon]MDW7989907.1 hypothetical protein [Archaeoglobaceae archaeon]
MFEIPPELILGVAFLGFVLFLSYMPRKKIGTPFKIPSFNFSRKNMEKKIKEIDKKLEEVVSADISSKEKIVKLEEATEEIAKKFEVKGDLLSEMQISNNLKEEKESNSLPEISLPSADLGELEKMKVESEVKLEENKEAETEKVEFDESDELLEDLAKEVEKRDEEHFDLLRELGGQKFSVQELEKELGEVLERVKRLKA